MSLQVVGTDGKPVNPIQTLKKPNLFICAFTYGGIEAATMDSLLSEFRLLDKAGVNFLFHRVHGDALISRSRSKALSAFMENDALDICVMVDHDIDWEAGTLTALALKCNERQCLLGGLYSTRGMGRGIASRLKAEAAKVKPGSDELLEAEYLAGGFLAIPKVVAKEVLKNGLQRDAKMEHGTVHNESLYQCLYNDGTMFHDYFRPVIAPATVLVPQKKPIGPVYEYLSEDWSFSWRARQANPNRPIYAWSMPWLLHHGDYPYTLTTAMQPRAGAQVTK